MIVSIRRITKIVLPAFSFVSIALAYLRTLAPSITWSNGGSDSGELVTASYYLGVAHPTGYPCYVFLAWLFSHLTFFSVAQAVNFLSLFAAVLAILVVMLWVAYLHNAENFTIKWVAASVAGLMLAFSPMFWSQAI